MSIDQTVNQLIFDQIKRAVDDLNGNAKFANWESIAERTGLPLPVVAASILEYFYHRQHWHPDMPCFNTSPDLGYTNQNLPDSEPLYGSVKLQPEAVDANDGWLPSSKRRLHAQNDHQEAPLRVVA